MTSFMLNVLKTDQLLKKCKMTTMVRFEHIKEGSTPSTHSSHKVNNLEKKFLVWTGKFKSVDEVPNYVPQNMVERARNRMRIRIANCMMAATVVGCIAMVYFGKQLAKRGDSVTQYNLDWHKQYNEEQKGK